MMDLLIELINKILFAGLVFSILGTLRVAFLFLSSMRKNPPEPLVLSTREIIALGIYISVIIMFIFTGVQI